MSHKTNYANQIITPTDDGTNAYVKNRMAFLAIADKRSRKVVVFKAFLDSYKLSLESEFEQEETFNLVSLPKQTSYKFVYDVSLTVPSFTKDEAEKFINKNTYGN